MSPVDTSVPVRQSSGRKRAAMRAVFSQKFGGGGSSLSLSSSQAIVARGTPTSDLSGRWVLEVPNHGQSEYIFYQRSDGTVTGKGRPHPQTGDGQWLSELTGRHDCSIFSWTSYVRGKNAGRFDAKVAADGCSLSGTGRLITGMRLDFTAARINMEMVEAAPAPMVSSAVSSVPAQAPGRPVACPPAPRSALLAHEEEVESLERFLEGYPDCTCGADGAVSRCTCLYKESDFEADEEEDDEDDERQAELQQEMAGCSFDELLVGASMAKMAEEPSNDRSPTKAKSAKEEALRLSRKVVTEMSQRLVA